MKITPLDLRQQRFKVGFRGFEVTEVVAFLTEAADDYEFALREVDRLRQDLARMGELLNDHRDREANVKNVLVTAQKVSEDLKESAQAEARLILKDAQGRADLLLQTAQGRLEGIERQIGELQLRRHDVELSLEASIASLQHALDFIRVQGKGDVRDKILMHRPRSLDPNASTSEADEDGPLERTAGRDA